MSRSVIAVSATTWASHAWNLLEEHDIKALPVVDANRHVIGIVTRADLVGMITEADLIAGLYRQTYSGQRRAA